MSNDNFNINTRINPTGIENYKDINSTLINDADTNISIFDEGNNQDSNIEFSNTKSTSYNSELNEKKVQDEIIKQLQAKINSQKQDLAAEKESRGFFGFCSAVFGGGTTKSKNEIKEKEEKLNEAINNPEKLKDVYKEITGKELTNEELSNIAESMQISQQLSAGDKEVIKNSLISEINNIDSALDKTIDDQGWFSTGFSKINNLLGLGTSENKSKAQIEALKQQIEELDTNSPDFAAQYAAITGSALNKDALTNLSNGQSALSQTKAAESIYDYQHTQDIGKEVATGIVVGLVSAACCLIPGVGPIMAIGVGALAGGATKILIKGTDTIGTSKNYSLEQGMLDFGSGAIDGAVSGIMLGGAGLSGQGINILKNTGKSTIEATGKVGLKQAFTNVGKSATRAVKIASFSSSSNYLLNTVGKTAIYKSTGNYTLSDVPSNIIQNQEDGTYSIYYDVKDANTGDFLYYQIEKVDSLNQDEDGNLIKGNILETSQSNDFSFIDLAKQNASSAAFAVSGAVIGKFTNGYINPLAKNLTNSGAIGNISEIAADATLSLGADYVLLSAQNGEWIDKDNFLSWDRLLGEGRNQLRSLFIGLATSKVNNIKENTMRSALSGDDSIDSSKIPSTQEDVIKTASEMVLSGDTESAQKLLSLAGMNDSLIKSFISDVESVKQELNIEEDTQIKTTDINGETNDTEILALPQGYKSTQGANNDCAIANLINKSFSGYDDSLLTYMQDRIFINDDGSFSVKITKDGSDLTIIVPKDAINTENSQMSAVEYACKQAGINIENINASEAAIMFGMNPISKPITSIDDNIIEQLKNNTFLQLGGNFKTDDNGNLILTDANDTDGVMHYLDFESYDSESGIVKLVDSNSGKIIELSVEDIKNYGINIDGGYIGQKIDDLFDADSAQKSFGASSISNTTDTRTKSNIVEERYSELNAKLANASQDEIDDMLRACGLDENRIAKLKGTDRIPAFTSEQYSKIIILLENGIELQNAFRISLLNQDALGAIKLAESGFQDISHLSSYMQEVSSTRFNIEDIVALKNAGLTDDETALEILKELPDSDMNFDDVLKLVSAGIRTPKLISYTIKNPDTIESAIRLREAGIFHPFNIEYTIRRPYMVDDVIKLCSLGMSTKTIYSSFEGIKDPEIYRATADNLISLKSANFSDDSVIRIIENPEINIENATTLKSIGFSDDSAIRILENPEVYFNNAVALKDLGFSDDSIISIIKNPEVNIENATELKNTGFSEETIIYLLNNQPSKIGDALYLKSQGFYENEIKILIATEDFDIEEIKLLHSRNIENRNIIQLINNHYKAQDYIDLIDLGLEYNAMEILKYGESIDSLIENIKTLTDLGMDPFYAADSLCEKFSIDKIIETRNSGVDDDCVSDVLRYMELQSCLDNIRLGETKNIQIEDSYYQIKSTDSGKSVSKISMSSIELLKNHTDFLGEYINMHSKFDLITELIHGPRIDTSLQDWKIKVGDTEVAIRTDNNFYTESYARENGIPLKGIAIDDSTIQLIKDAIIQMDKTGQKIPSELYITSLFGKSTEVNGQIYGVFSSSNPDAIFINKDTILAGDIQSTIYHESAHYMDYKNAEGNLNLSDTKGIEINPNKPIKFATDTGEITIQAKDVERLISNYSLLNHKEFIAEVTALITSGKIKIDANNNYVLVPNQQGRYTNAKGISAFYRPEFDIETLNNIMKLYSILTEDKITVPQSIEEK